MQYNRIKVYELKRNPTGGGGTITPGYGNTAFVSPGGNNSTAVLGDNTKPFATIGAAVTALGVLSNSLLYICSGSYTMTHADSPYGIKYPGSSYNIYREPGVNITYSGTYGFFIADGTTSGGLFGYGDINCTAATFSGAVSGVSNYAVNVLGSGPITIEGTSFRCTNTGTNANAMRFDNATTDTHVLRNFELIYANGGNTILCDDTSFLKAYGNCIEGRSVNGKTALVITTPLNIDFKRNTIVSTQGDGVAAGQLRILSINNLLNATITFEQNTFIVTAPPSTFRVVELTDATVSQTNLSFIKNILYSRKNAAYTSDGYSFYTDTNKSIKLLDVFAGRDAGGAGTITNLITTGSGFQVDSSL